MTIPWQQVTTIRVGLELPSRFWLCVQEMLAFPRHHRLAAFPPPELPGFIGTMQPSDFRASSVRLPYSG
jgi:hypothetical protein